MRQKHATFDEIALRLLHAVTRKLNDFNFPATECNNRMSHKISPFTQRDFVARRIFVASCKRALN